MATAQQPSCRHKSSERTKRLDSAIQVQTANLVSKGINLHAEQAVFKYQHRRLLVPIASEAKVLQGIIVVYLRAQKLIEHKENLEYFSNLAIR